MVSLFKRLRFDPIPVLLASDDEAVRFLAGRDLLGEEKQPVESLWDSQAAQRILRRQRDDGSWKYPGGGKGSHSPDCYDQLETFRNLGILVEKYGFDSKHESVVGAAEFLFRFQADDGDFRGIYGDQYTTNYTGAIMEVLVKSGYGDDPRIEKGFEWLVSFMQDDGGWTFPVQTSGVAMTDDVLYGERLEPEFSKPFSHLTTGMVLRAFAAHERYRRSREARSAAGLMVSRFFKRDPYRGRNTPQFWERVSFPFWFTDIVSSLDSVSRVGTSGDDPGIDGALSWLREKQGEDGLFELKLLKTGDKNLGHWVTLAVCRIFQRFQSG